MDESRVALIIGLITAVVTIVGWYSTRRREDRTRRIELSMRHYERQMEEFYGPIYNLIQVIWSINLTKEQFEESLKPQDNPEDLPAIHARINNS
jgi:hypothetical protein